MRGRSVVLTGRGWCLVCPPGAGKGPRPSSSPRTSLCRRSRPATSSGPTSPRARPLGVEAKRYMDAGELVPDEVTINMVRDRLAEPDAGDGFLLDGFPRTVRRPPRWTSCSPIWAPPGSGPGAGGRRRRGDPAALRPAYLPGLRQDLARRVRPHQPEGICDRCGAELFQRDDDKAETIAKRLVSTARRPRRWSTTTAPRASWSASTPPGRWRTSRSGPSTRCGRTAAEPATRIRCEGAVRCTLFAEGTARIVSS